MKNKRNSSILVFLFLVGCVLAGSAASEDRLIYSSSQRQPGWILRPPNEMGFLYFVGIYSDARTHEQARETAIKNAAGQIAEYMGIRIKTRHEQTTTEISNEIIDWIESSSSEVLVRNAIMKEAYYEKWSKKTGKGKELYYNAYVLIRYSEKEIEKERVRLKQQREAKEEESRKYLLSAGENVLKGRIKKAFLDYSFSLKILKGVENSDESIIEIINEAMNVYNNIEIRKLENDPFGTVREGLKNPLVVKVVYKSRSGDIPVSKVLVNFNFTRGRGMLDKGVYTDREGLAKCWVSGINTLKPQNSVEARIVFQYMLKTGIPWVQEFIKKIAPVKEEFTFQIKGTVEDILFSRLNIAVMPFENMTGDSSLDWLGRGITEAVSYKLSRINNLKVIETDRPEITGKLIKSFRSRLKRDYEVDFVVTGGFQKAAGSIRISSRVQEVETGEVLGASMETGKKDVLFDVEDRTALKIAGILKISITNAERISMRKREAANLEAYRYFCRGLVYHEGEDYNNALKMYGKAIKLDPGYDAPHVNKGVIYFLKHIYGKAISSYKKAIELNPLESETFLNLGIAYYSMGKNEEAVLSFKRSIELDRFNSKAYMALGAFYNEKELHDDAIDILKQAIDIDQNNSELFNSLGIAFDGKKMYNEAIEIYRKAIRNDPLNTRAYNNIGVSYKNKSMYLEAIDAYKVALGFDLANATLWNNLGHSYLKLSLLENALFSYLRSIEVDSSLVAANYNLAGLYSIMKKLDLSIEYMKKAINLGYKDYDYIEADDAFDNVRGISSFAEVVKELRK